MAEHTLKQIIKKRYADMFNYEYKAVYGIGICFYKKSCEIESHGHIAKDSKDNEL